MDFHKLSLENKSNISRTIENIVFTELLRREYEVKVAYMNIE